MADRWANRPTSLLRTEHEPEASSTVPPQPDPEKAFTVDLEFLAPCKRFHSPLTK